MDGGFLLEEEHLNNIETALAVNGTLLETANASIVTLTEELSTEKANVTTITSLKETAEQKVTEQAARIVALEAEVVALGQKPSGKGTNLSKEKDESPEEGDKPSYASETNPANEWLDKQMALRQKAKV